MSAAVKPGPETIGGSPPARSDGGSGSRKLKILYVQPGTSSFAGIERVVDMICTELATTYASEFQIDVIYTSIHDNYPSEPRAYNAIRRLATGRFSLLSLYRDVISNNRYDLIVVPQIEPTVLLWFASLGLKQRLAMALHGNPKLERSNMKSKIKFFIMRKFVLSRLSYVFGTSPRQLESFASMFETDVPRYWTPNPVRRFDKADEQNVGEPPRVTFVNVGRFAHQKGQDILIDAFAELHAKRPNARLKLVGFGQDEAGLRAQIDRLGMDAFIIIEHHATNPQDALARSDVFVSTSRWEGWSLVICEALRFGLPVISTDCDFGPSDILIDERLGRLVPNFSRDGLINAMIYYHDHLAEEKRYSAFRKSSIDVYSVDQVVHEHAKALRLAVGTG